MFGNVGQRKTTTSSSGSLLHYLKYNRNCDADVNVLCEDKLSENVGLLPIDEKFKFHFSKI